MGIVFNIEPCLLLPCWLEQIWSPLEAALSLFLPFAQVSAEEDLLHCAAIWPLPLQYLDVAERIPGKRRRRRRMWWQQFCSCLVRFESNTLVHLYCTYLVFSATFALLEGVLTASYSQFALFLWVSLGQYIVLPINFEELLTTKL